MLGLRLREGDFNGVVHAEIPRIRLVFSANSVVSMLASSRPESPHVRSAQAWLTSLTIRRTPASVGLPSPRSGFSSINIVYLGRGAGVSQVVRRNVRLAARSIEEALDCLGCQGIRQFPEDLT